MAVRVNEVAPDECLPDVPAHVMHLALKARTAAGGLLGRDPLRFIAAIRHDTPALFRTVGTGWADAGESGERRRVDRQRPLRRVRGGANDVRRGERLATVDVEHGHGVAPRVKITTRRECCEVLGPRLSELIHKPLARVMCA